MARQHIARGDHIKADRGKTYEHHGINIGDGTVVHFRSADDKARGMQIHRDPLERFGEFNSLRKNIDVEISDYEIVEYQDGATFHPDLTCIIALTQLREQPKYSVASNNCEQFAHYCKTGEKWSSQIMEILDDITGHSQLGIFHPGYMLTGPVFVAAERGVRFLIGRLRGSQEKRAAPGPAKWHTRPLFRTGESYGYGHKTTHFLDISERWFEVLGPDEPLREIGYSPNGVQLQARWWVDDRMVEYVQTHRGWFMENGVGNWVPCRREVRRLVESNKEETTEWLATAPLGALNALIEVPSSLQEKVDAMEELGMRQRADFTAYQLLVREAITDTSQLIGQQKDDYDYVRQAAFWTLGLLNQGQHRNTSTMRMPGISTIARTIADENEPVDVRIAAVQSLQVLERHTDATVRQLLRQALQSSSLELREYAQAVLNGARLSSSF